MCTFTRHCSHCLLAAVLLAVIARFPVPAAADDHPAPRASTSTVSPERQKLYEQYKALHQKIDAAKKDGDNEQLRLLTREMMDLQRKLAAAQSDSAMLQARRAAEAARSPDSTGAGREARLQHLRAAAENLKAAGCGAEAEHVMELIHQLQAEAAQREVARRETESALRYLGAAAEKLKAAGLEPEARHVMELIKRIEAETKGTAATLTDIVDVPVTTPRYSRNSIIRLGAPDANPLTPSPRYSVETVVRDPLPSLVPHAPSRPSPAMAGPGETRELHGQIERVEREIRELREEISRLRNRDRG